jgi:serine/threonine-protein kinase RsbW
MKKLIVPASFTSLEEIRDYFSRAAQEAGLDEEAIFEVQVAVDEAASNIIDHAYEGECESEIECSYEIMKEKLKLNLHDHGKHFDPEKVELPDIMVDPTRRKKGGLGLYFMRQMMDEVNFSFSGDGGNDLTMIKRRGPKV